MVGGSERRGQKDSLPAWIRAARREPPSLDTPLFIILSPFSSIIVPISSLFLPLFITGTWMDKQRNADQFEYRELGYPLFEIFAEARGPSLSPFPLLVSIYTFLSLSLLFSPDPARFDRRLSRSSFQRIREHRGTGIRDQPRFPMELLPMETDRISRGLPSLCIDKVAPRKVFRLLSSSGSSRFFHSCFQVEEIYLFLFLF